VLALSLACLYDFGSSFHEVLVFSWLGFDPHIFL
jgi:hypothetical protein